MNKLAFKMFSIFITILMIFGTIYSVLTLTSIIPFNQEQIIDDQSSYFKTDLEVRGPQKEKAFNNDQTRGEYFDIIINSNKMYNEDKIVKNLTILGDATLNIENCNFEIRGKLTVRNNARLFIKNSNITIAPGPEGPQEIIINFSDKAKIKIENSNVYTYPQPTLTNISYLLSDDESEVTIINSYLNLKLPAILHMDIELTPPTAGTFILTGNTIWHIYSTKIEGFLRINEENILVGRWFLFTLQRNAQLYMKDCYGYMNDSNQPFIKPVAGFVSLEDCNIVYGVIDAEVVAEFEARNLSIEELNLRDQTKSTLINCNIANNVDAGSVAIVPSAAGSISFDDNPKSLPKAHVYVEDTVIGQTFIAQGNSTNELVNCKIGNFLGFAEGGGILRDSEVNTIAEVKESGSLEIYNSTVFTINMGDRSTLKIIQNPTMHAINKITSGFNCQGNVELHSTTINLLDIFGGDQVLPPYKPGYDPENKISRINLNIYDSTIKSLKTEDDSEISISIENSEISKFQFKRVKNESVKITILDLGGTYDLPDPWPMIDLEIQIYHQLILETFVNENPVKSRVTISNQQGKIIQSTITNEQGSKILDLNVKNIKDNITTTSGSYEITAEHFGFSKSFITMVGINEEQNISWTDLGPPVISNIVFDSSYHNTARPTRISAQIFDSDVKAIANATIYYKFDKGDGSGWSAWIPSLMLEVENDTFEGEIEDLPDGTKVKFYIESYDILNNKIVSYQKSYTVENPNILTLMVGVLFLIIMIILTITYFIKKRAKLKDYINRTSKNVSRVKNENDEYKKI